MRIPDVTPPSRRLAKSALDSYLVEDGFLIGLGEGRKKRKRISLSSNNAFTGMKDRGRGRERERRKRRGRGKEEVGWSVAKSNDAIYIWSLA